MIRLMSALTLSSLSVAKVRQLLTQPHDPTYTIAHGTASFAGLNPKTTRVLLAMVVPGHLIFIFVIKFMKAGHTTISFNFILIYNAAAVIQVSISFIYLQSKCILIMIKLSSAFQVIVLLYCCNTMVHWMWKKGDDPDNFAIPYLTALGDLLGTSLLAAAFLILYSIGDKDFDVGD